MKTLSKAEFLSKLAGHTTSIPGTMCKCGGTMFNVTSRLAQATGVMHTRCDGCGRKEAQRIVEAPAKPAWYE